MPPERFLYFYITYQGSGFFGHMAMKQSMLPDGTYEGLNLGSAHQRILDLLGSPVVIMTWNQISERRYNEFNAFADKTYRGHQAPKLTVHDGGNRNAEPRDKTRPGETKLKPLKPPVDSGSGTSNELRGEKVRGPQLEEGNPDQPPPGRSS